MVILVYVLRFSVWVRDVEVCAPRCAIAPFSGVVQGFRLFRFPAHSAQGFYEVLRPFPWFPAVPSEVSTFLGCFFLLSPPSFSFDSEFPFLSAAPPPFSPPEVFGVASPPPFFSASFVVLGGGFCLPPGVSMSLSVGDFHGIPAPIASGA